MRDIRTLGMALLAGMLTAGCAARIPSSETFNPARWAAVEALTPGARVEVRYVTGNPPLRHDFEGTLLRASPDILEIQTEDGVQRLLPQRVLRVAAGGRTTRVLPLTIIGAGLGAVLGNVMAGINENSDDVTRRKTVMGASIGALLGLSFGLRTGDARPLVIYSRSGSL